jgi:hypothetical protein
VPLALLDLGFAAATRIVFYAGTPGAFVDLAADLAFALRGANTSERADDSALAILLDEDPPPRTRGFSLAGLTEMSTIDRAVGVLIGRGHHPDHVYATLRRAAARASMEPHVWAAQLLSRMGINRLE